MAPGSYIPELKLLPFPPCNSKIGKITNFANERTPFSVMFPSSQNAWNTLGHYTVVV
jgi:hypothetical protein